MSGAFNYKIIAGTVVQQYLFYYIERTVGNDEWLVVGQKVHCQGDRITGRESDVYSVIQLQKRVFRYYSTFLGKGQVFQVLTAATFQRQRR